MSDMLSSLGMDTDSLIRLEALLSSQAKGFILCFNKGFYDTPNWEQILSVAILEEPATPNNHFVFSFSDQNTIGIDEVKEIGSMLAIKSVTNKRIFIINKAERMSLEAANSLLKILEELPERTYMILTTTLFTKIVPTIRSRLPVYFLYAHKSQVDNENIVSMLKSKDFSSILAVASNPNISPSDYNQLISDICAFIMENHPEYSSEVTKIVGGLGYNINPKLILESLILILI